MAEALPGWGLTFLLPSLPPPALDFYQRRGFLLGDSTRTSALLRPVPYVPQCDVWGGWEPVQCHARTGEWGWAPGGERGVTPPFSFGAEDSALGPVSWTLGPSLASGGKSLSGLWFSHLHDGSWDLPA